MSSPTVTTIKRLFAASGNQCAFPGCALPLVDPDSGAVLGEICHVRARSPGGPRYDATQTEEQCHAFENLLLLCPSHHKIVDDNPDVYPVERLLEIKARHEAQHAGEGRISDNIVRRLMLWAEIGGDVSGQFAQGENITQIQAHIYGEVSRTLLTWYTPLSLDDPNTLPDRGPLPQGSRIPFMPNETFTGRVEPLKALAQSLLYDEAPSALVTQAVRGMGGVGKTQLAVEFAYRYGRYFHGVHWINAAQPEGIGVEVAECGRAMALPNWPAEQPDQIALTLALWRQGGARLVVLDNLEDIATAREWLGRLSGGQVRVLLTARRGRWPRDLGLSVLRLDVFTPQESRAFLRQHLDKERASDEELDDLAKRLGHLPLALELAGRYVAYYPRLPVAEYLQELDDAIAHRAMRDWHAEEGSPTDHDLHLEDTFALSWERITDERACRLFLTAGYCAPNQPIPRELLRQALGLSPPEDEGGDGDTDLDAFEDGLGTLICLGLLEVETPGGDPTIHPLLAEYARRLAAGDEEVLTPLTEALARLANQANEQMDQTGSPSHFLPLLPHIRLIAQAAERERAEKAADLWNSLGYHLHRVAGLAEARVAYERALAIDEAVYGPDHPNVATLVNNLGVVLQDLGELAGARAAYERALAIDEAVYGPDHPEVAGDVSNLGLVLRDMGEPREARAAYERALAIDEAVYGPHHPDVARDVNNLGLVLRDLGKLAEARAAFERALGILERSLPPDHPKIRAVRNSLESLG
jgi:tetratricopeptide (TPR) repeat protein